MLGVPPQVKMIMGLRQGGLTDLKVLEAIERVPRERFVDHSMQAHAYDDTALPIACGQTISQPFVVAFMTTALKLLPGHKVLEIGTGSGFQTAVLAQLCRRVYTIERHRPLRMAAEALLTKLGYTNIIYRLGDGIKGWREQAPFERILVTAAAPAVPKALLEQLAVGGILVAPIGDAAGQDIRRVTRTEYGVETETLLPVRFVPLVEGIAPPA